MNGVHSGAPNPWRLCTSTHAWLLKELQDSCRYARVPVDSRTCL